MRRWYVIALICGFIPMLIGLGLFVAWLVTRQAWLVFAGLVSFYPLLLVLFGGIAAMGVFIRKSRAEQQPYRKKALKILGVLLLNFPIAAGLSFITYEVMTRFTLVIANESDNAVKGGIVRDPAGQTHTIPAVAPHAEGSSSYHFKGEGAATYVLNRDAIADQSGMLDSYVTEYGGGSARLLIDADGAVSVKKTGPEE